MPDPAVRLDVTRLSAAPGGQARVQVTVHNLGQIVEGFRLEVLGDHVAHWAAVHPEEIPVYPQQEATALVVFTVPDGVGAASGVLPFGILVRSVVDAASTAVVEGDLEVAQVFGLQAKLSPVTSRGRWRGRHELRITNWGNAPARLSLVAGDPDERLGFLVHPDELDVPLGGTARARVTVRTRHPFLRGTPTRLPFQVVADSGPLSAAPPDLARGAADPHRVMVDGALTQLPILSKLVLAVATLAVVAAVAGGALFLLRKNPEGPPPPSTAPADSPRLTAVPAGANAIRLTWKKVDSIDNYQLLEIDPNTNNTLADTQKIDKAALQVNASTFDGQPIQAGTKYCFALVSVRGKLNSQSATKCATTARAARTTTGTGVPGNPTGGPGPSKWVSMVNAFPADQGDASAQKLVADLSAEGVTARYLLSSAYPQPKKPSGSPMDLKPSYVVYLGPFDTPEEAAAAQCPAPFTECIPFQPGAEAAPGG